ncbi:MAG: hypothetical protein FJY80_07880 [Candidatus Aminicenantes bacterium]|nr:hypothetical protein [Candidatus Aminicenantes bacterium]
MRQRNGVRARRRAAAWPAWLFLLVLALASACASSPSGTAPASTASAEPSTTHSPAPRPDGQLPPRTKPERACEFSGVSKVVAVGDLHGAYDAFVEILKGTKMVEVREGEIHWAGGTSHLVQLGDVMDRGKAPRKIFDLIALLEGEALVAGGRVHMLIGNHEEMNIMELSFEVPGNVTIEQFKEFMPAKFVRDKEREFRRAAGSEGDTEPYWDELLKDPSARQRYYDEFNRDYGRWIARHNAVVKVNDVVFVHGGLNESYSTYPCRSLNAILSNELDQWIRGDRSFFLRLAHNEQGPLWYRSLAMPESEDLLKDEVGRTLKNLGARAMVIGHTPTQGSISLSLLHRFDRRVWMIDTGIWMESGGALSALVIQNGEFRVWPVDDISGWKPPEE